MVHKDAGEHVSPGTTDLGIVAYVWHNIVSGLALERRTTKGTMKTLHKQVLIKCL